MKLHTFATLLSASQLVQAGPVVPNGDKSLDWASAQNMQKRQILGTLTWMLGKGGKVADPPGAAPRRQIVPTNSKIAGVQRIKMRYGPYSVPNMNKTGLTGEAGALWNYPDASIAKPCTECTIVQQFAGLEYPDGKNANIDTGMWLHHMVHLNIGPGRNDPTCFGSPSLPHVDVGASPQNSERYFSSGNERTKVEIDALGPGSNVGYHLKPTDRFAFIVDLMNMNMEDKTVYLTMYYDIIDGPMPAGWRDLKVVWFDANQCGTSEVKAAKQDGAYTVPTRPWKPNFEGDILGVGSHVHDGGVTVDILAPQAACKSVAKYGETPEYVFNEPMGSMKNYAKKHISSMSACYGNQMQVRKLSKDQSWQIKCNYDYNQAPGNRAANGHQEEVMCIALMYVAIPYGSNPLASGAPAGGAGGAAAARPKGLGGAKGALGAAKGTAAPPAKGAAPAAAPAAKGVAPAAAPAAPAAAAPAAAAPMAGMSGHAHGRVVDEADVEKYAAPAVKFVDWDGDVNSPVEAGIINFD